MERYEFWGWVRGLGAVLYLKEHESGNQDMLSVHMHTRNRGRIYKFDILDMDMEIVGYLARHKRGVS
jgi:hypothetical protein